MTDYDNRGDVAVWHNQSDNPKVPTAKGTVIAHRDIKEGETVEIALWRNQSDNPKAPAMKGKLSDKRQQTEGKQRVAVAEGYGPADDSDLPF